MIPSRASPASSKRKLEPLQIIPIQHHLSSRLIRFSVGNYQHASVTGCDGVGMGQRIYWTSDWNSSGFIFRFSIHRLTPDTWPRSLYSSSPSVYISPRVLRPPFSFSSLPPCLGAWLLTVHMNKDSQTPIVFFRAKLGSGLVHGEHLVNIMNMCAMYVFMSVLENLCQAGLDLERVIVKHGCFPGLIFF